MKKAIRLSFIFTLVLSLVLLCACAPKNAEKAKAKMEKAGYVVRIGDAAEMQFDNKYNADKWVSASTEDGKNYVVAVSFKTAKDAKAYYEENKKNAEESEDTEMKLSGKWIVAGTKQAVKDFLK